MITVLRIVALSLLVGFVAAGFVWYGSMLGQNVLALLRRRAAAKPPPIDEKMDKPTDSGADKS